MNSAKEQVPVGYWWADDTIPLYEINGAVYALYGWNGEAWTDCWECVGENHMDAGKGAVVRPEYRFQLENADLSAVEENSEEWDRLVQITGFTVSAL